MPINALPVPTPEEVDSFAALYLREFGVHLNREEAWDAATRVLRLFCLATYGLPAEPPTKGQLNHQTQPSNP